jgi:O-antigen/teichoic acid export membrane protein
MTAPDPISASDALPHGPRRLSVKAFTGLTGVQVLQLLFGFATGPLIARALGAEGRGVLAAIVVPLGVLPFVAQLGLGSFAVNRVAKGVNPARVVGSLGVPLLVVGAVIALTSPLLAGAISEGREPVEQYLTIGLALLPIGLLLNLLLDVTWGLEAWRSLVAARFLVAASALVAIVVLYALHRLSVESAAIVTIASSFTAALALGPVLRRIGRPRVDLRLSRSALAYGVRAWPGTLASLANQRLDQLLMIPLVSARELGLYAVAVTIASLSTVLSSQITTVVLPRIAGGETGLLPPAMRVVLLTVLGTQVLLAVGTMLFLVPVFGASFADSKQLVLVLLVGWLAQSGVSALAQSLASTGRPGAPSIGELVSLAITIPGLIVLLPVLGAMGAALVTAVAYVVTFAVLVVIASRHFGHRKADYVVPRREDLRTLVRLARPLLASVGGR